MDSATPRALDDRVETESAPLKIHEVDDEKPYDCTVRLRFPSEHLAKVAMNSLSADKELRGNKVARTMVVTDEDGNSDEASRGKRYILQATFRARELRLLRVCVSSFYDMTSIIVRTQLEFADI